MGSMICPVVLKRYSAPGFGAGGLGAAGADAGFNGAPYFAGVQHAAAMFVGDERVFFTVRRKEVTP